MPRATVKLEETEKIDLKTLPGAWIEIRRLTYGQKLERRAMSTASAEGRGKANMKMTIELMNRRATLFDFTHCIMDHNLEDENGSKLNLQSPSDIDRLDPRIGEEIEKRLDGLNNFEEDEEDTGN
jgi:hypothetical protein